MKQVIIPSNFKMLYSAKKIDQAVKQLGESISAWAADIWADSHTDILAVPVLRGGIFFFADLVRAIPYSVEIAPVKTWGYVAGVNEQKTSDVTFDITQVPAKGRRVLLIDDVCDSGRTLHKLKEAFLAAGALDVRAAVLIRREIPDSAFSPEWCGFRYSGPEWFVGYGMEDSDRWRNLPAVYIISQS